MYAHEHQNTNKILIVHQNLRHVELCSTEHIFRPLRYCYLYVNDIDIIIEIYLKAYAKATDNKGLLSIRQKASAWADKDFVIEKKRILA